MYKFLKLVTLHKDYFVFVILIIISLALISANFSNEIGGFRSVIIATFGKLQNVFSWIPNPIDLQNENKTLIDLNIQLSNEVAAMRRATFENETLRSMLELKKHAQHPLIPCDIVNKSSIQLRNFVTLNKGSKAGIRKGMCVISVAGLAGTIIGTNENYSMVELLNNQHVKIPATLSESKFEGIIGWEGDDFLYLNYIPKTQKIKVGETVITSLFSNIYPDNIIIGKVHRIGNDPSSHFHRIYIKPATRFFDFTQLFVINYIKNPKEVDLMNDIENKILNLSGGK